MLGGVLVLEVLFLLLGHGEVGVVGVEFALEEALLELAFPFCQD